MVVRVDEKVQAGSRYVRQTHADAVIIQSQQQSRSIPTALKKNGASEVSSLQQ
jgi:hypothetical protein